MRQMKAVLKKIRGSLKCVFLMVVLLSVWTGAAFAADLTVAVLKSEGNFPVEDLLAGFRQEMQLNGVAVQLVQTSARDDFEAPADAPERRKPDLFFCIGVKALERAASVKHIPKFYSMITYEHARPWHERNDVFGVTLDVAPSAQFRILRQALPQARRIGVLYDPERSQRFIEETRKAALASGFSLTAVPVGSIRDIPLALQKMENHADVLWTIYDQTAYTPESAKYMLLATLGKKIPMVGLSPNFARAGALLAIYGDYEDMGRQVALQAIAVLRNGEHGPQTARPRKVLVDVNEKVGRIMDIHFPASFMKTVHKVY